MKTKSIKRQIGIISDAPQQQADLLALLNDQPQFDVAINNFETASILPGSRAYDVILYCALSTDHDTSIINAIERIRRTVPVIALLDHPTVGQTVDLMRAGSSGVVDWRDSRRILELIETVLDAGLISPSEAIYQDIVDQQTELICRYDAELRLLFVNRAYCEWQGMPAEELIGTRITEKIPAEERERVTAHVRALTVDNPAAVSVHATILPDGSVRIVEWTDRAIFDAAGQLIEYQGVGRDVTEREQQAQQLATYRAHFDAVLDTMQDALMSISLPDKQVIFVSHAFEEVLGYSHEHFIENRDFFQQVVHPDDLERAAQAMQTCMTEGFVELDHRIIWPDGQVRWIHRRAWINYNANGQPLRVNDSARDITARKMAEDALRSSDAHLKSLIDSQTNYLIRTDLDGQYTYWNTKFEREFGWLHEPDGMFGSLSLSSIMPYHHQRTLEIVEKCLAEPGVPFQVELDKPRRDGTVCTTLWEFICLADAKGTPTAFQCVGIDVTEQKKAQATVQFQANLLQQVSDAIIATDNDLRITSWNKAAVDIYGWTEVEAIGQEIDTLLKTEWFDQSQESARVAIERDGHWRGEIRQTDKAGGQHYVVASVNPLYDELNNLIGGITVNRDITAEKRRDILQERINQTLEATAERQQLPVILEKLVLAVEEFEPDIRASVLLLDAATDQLRHGAAPSLPDAYNAAIDGIGIGSGVGSCGTAAYEKRLVIVSDITTDPLWKDFKGLAAEHGLRACWSQPIMGHGGRVLGTFALYYAAPRPPATEEVDLIRLAARIAGLVIEHAQAETALRESEEEYRSLVESSEAAIAVFDLGGNLQFANEIAAVQLGSSPESLVGKHMRELFPPAVADYQLTSIHNVIQTGKGSVNEAPSYVSGAVRWYRTSVQPIRNAAGEITTALIHASDITQFKAMEEALRQSEEQFRQFMRYLPGAVFIKDDAERTLYCNERYASVSGTTPENIIGKRSQDYMPEDLAAAYTSENEQVLRAGHALEFHHSVPGADGLSHWLTIKFPIPREGQPSLLGAISLDITQQKRAEAAVKRSEERYRRMFEDVSLPKLITDPQTARILDANPAAVDFYGYSLDTLKSMTMLQINIAEPAVILKKMQQVLNGEIRSCLFEQRLANGAVREVEGFAAGIELNGQQVLYCTYIDVTERNRAQAALEEANQQLEQRVQERTRALEQSKDRIEAIFNHSGDGILLLDNALKIKQSNYAFDQMFAIPHDTYFDKLLFELMLDVDRTRLAAQLPDVTERHETRRMEIKGRRVDGTTFDAEISVAPVNRSDKAVQNVVCIVRDASERKQAEAERQKYMAEIADLYNNAPAGYHSLDSAGFFVQINDTELGWLGYSREEVVARLRFAELLTPQSQQVFREKFPLLQQTGAIDSVEFELLCKDGSTIWVLGSASIIRDENGEFVRSRATLYNITELKAKTEALRISEQRLRESENRLQLVLDTIPVRVFWKDTNSVYLGCNRLFAEDAGLADTDEIVGKRDLDMPWAALAEAYRADDKAVIESGIAKLNFEEPLLAAGGQSVILQTSKIPLRDANDQIIGILGTSVDITDRKAADAALALRQAQERERQSYLTALHEITLELTRAETLDDYYRTTVVQGRQKLGLERMALLLYDPATDGVSGTYGTDTDGSLVDERHLHFDPDRQPGLLRRTTDRALRFAVEEQVQLFTGDRAVGVGQNAVAALWNQGLLGWLAVDNGIHHRPITQVQLDTLALYALTAGSLLARKRAEFALRDSEERYRTLINTMSEGIVLQDRDGAIRAWNPAAERILGLSAEEIEGRKSQDARWHSIYEDGSSFPGDNHPAMVALKTGEAQSNVVMGVHKPDGSLRWILINSQPIFGADHERPVAAVTTFTDITGRKQSEEDLRKVTERLQLATEAGEIGIWDFDAENNRMLWDLQMYALYGVDAATITPSIAFWSTCIHPDDLAQTHADTEAAIRGEQPYDTEFRIVKPDGATRHIRAKANIYRNQKGTAQRIVGVNFDVTHVKQAEETLRSALEKEKELSVLKSRFVSMASHQFRTPLAAILANTETLSIYRDRLDSAQINIRLERIRKQVNYMKSIMEDVLELARIQANQIQYQPVEGNLDALCREIIEDFAHQEGYRSRIIYEGSENAPVVTFDPHLMHHVVNNLIHNALKYSPDASLVYITLSQTEQEITLNVKDQGIGIPPEDLKHLFEPFYRASNVGAVSGTGLGLSIVKQAVEAHGGSIQVESRLEGGTAFIVTMPIQRTEDNRNDENTGD